MARQNGVALAAGLDDDETPEPTVRESLEAARDEVVANHESEASADGQAGTPARADGSESGGRERDQSGRFAPKARADGAGDGADPAPARAAAAPTQAQDEAAGRATPPVENHTDINLAPRLWSQSAKAEWSKLPESIRREVSMREQAMHRQFTAQDNEREIGRSFRTTATPYNDVIQAAGVHPVRVFEDSLKVIRELQSADPIRKATALGHLARQYGIDPRLFSGAAPGQAGAPGQPAAGRPAAPSFELPPHLQTMASEWDQFKAQQQAAHQQAQEAMAASVMTEIQSFQSDPANKYFDQVKDHMRILLAGGGAQTLAEAYDQAIYARPDIRDLLIKEKTGSVKAAADKALQVQRARNRNVSVRGRGGSAAPSTPTEGKSLRETLTEGFAAARSRV